MRHDGEAPRHAVPTQSVRGFGDSRTERSYVRGVRVFFSLKVLARPHPSYLRRSSSSLKDVVDLACGRNSRGWRGRGGGFGFWKGRGTTIPFEAQPSLFSFNWLRLSPLSSRLTSLFCSVDRAYARFYVLETIARVPYFCEHTLGRLFL